MCGGQRYINSSLVVDNDMVLINDGISEYVAHIGSETAEKRFQLRPLSRCKQNP